MDIKVLGPGCRNCVLLEERTREALAQLHKTARIEKVSDFEQIMGYGVMTTPALVVDSKVAVAGKVPSTRKLTAILGP
jgi:small redox-active disulfide protein 2